MPGCQSRTQRYGWNGAAHRGSRRGRATSFDSQKRYPLCGKGDVNTYALFAEHNWDLLAPRGCAGFIVPSGIVTDDTTKHYFQAVLARHALASVHHFENESLVFKGLDHRYRFVLFTIRESRESDLVFYARRATDLEEPWRHFALTPNDFVTLNPNTRTCPHLQVASRRQHQPDDVPSRRGCYGGKTTRTAIHGDCGF